MLDYLTNKHETKILCKPENSENIILLLTSWFDPLHSFPILTAFSLASWSDKMNQTRPEYSIQSNLILK